MAGRVLMAARWVVGHENGSHVLHEDGEVVFEGDRIVFVGHDFPGEVERRVDRHRGAFGVLLTDTAPVRTCTQVMAPRPDECGHIMESGALSNCFCRTRSECDAPGSFVFVGPGRSPKAGAGAGQE